MLPDMNGTIDDAEPGTQRHTQLLRAIHIQAMVEGTARARVQRALQTRTLPAGQGRGLKIGEFVDARRNTNVKDVTSWKGPAKVIDNTDIERGIVTIRYQMDLPIEVRLQDIRQHLE